MKRSTRWINVFVLLAYVVTAVGMTWPLAARITTHLPGRTEDTLVHYWNGWWVQQALRTGQSPFYTPYLFYPQGLSLVYHNFAWMNIVPWLLLCPWMGKVAAYNVPVLLNLALCGLTAFLLAYDLTQDRPAAFLAGLIYQCWPSRLAHLVHPNLIGTQWMPLFLLFLLRAVRHGRWRDGVLTGLFFLLVGYTRWQLLIPATIMGSICGLWGLLRWRIPWQRSVLILLLAGGIAGVGLAPPLLLLVRQQRTAAADLLVEEDEIAMQTDLLAYLTPSPDHPLLRSLVRPAYERYYADRSVGRRFPAYVGVITLLLALGGVWQARRTGLPWVVMALVLLLLALGPILRVDGQLYPAVPMPYRLASQLFVVRLLRFPDRFTMFLALPIAMLAAYGLTGVLALARRRGKWPALALACLFGGVILFEYLSLPLPLQRPETSAFYLQMAAEPEDFAVLNLPVHVSAAKQYMAAQVVHQHPILQGKTPRFPEGTFAYLDSHPWLRIVRLASGRSPDLPDVGRHLLSLARDDVRYLILHKEHIADDQIARWRRYLVMDPQFEDRQIAVYPTAPLAGRDFVLAQELAPGIGVVQAVVSTDCLNPGRVLAVDVGWGTAAAPGRDFHVALALAAADGGVQQEEVLPLSPSWPTGEWPAHTVAWGYYDLHARPALPSGGYTVTLALVDAATGERQGQPSALGVVTVREAPCPFEVAPGAVGANALFGDELRLLDYRLHQDGELVNLALRWRAERRMGTGWSIFVHVFEPGSGVPVAQDDAMPRRNTYPTTMWRPGEIVDDVVPISLTGVPAGTYGVALGVYDPATLERLPVVDGAGADQPDGRFVLPGETLAVGTP